MIETLKKWANESKRIVFFGGAGVSTEIVPLVLTKKRLRKQPLFLVHPMTLLCLCIFIYRKCSISCF